MTKPLPVEQIIADNQYGLIFMGPSGEQDKVGESVDTNMIVDLKGGQHQTYTLGGNKAEIIPGNSHEICGTNLTKERNEGEKELDASNFNNNSVVLHTLCKVGSSDV